MGRQKETKNKSSLLTSVELELMTILWEIGEGSVNDVLERLPKDRPLAYTSVSTMLRILEQKKVLKSRKEGRGHIYIPHLKKSDFETRTLNHVVDRVFGGMPVALIKQLLQTKDLTKEDLLEIKDLIDRTREQK